MMFLDEGDVSPNSSLPSLQTAGWIMQHYGVNGYSLHAMNSLSAMYNLHQQAAQQAQHAPDYRPSVHALTLAERLAGKKLMLVFSSLKRSHHPRLFKRWEADL